MSDILADDILANNILNKIVAHKRREVAELKKRHRLEHLGLRARPLKDGGAFHRALAVPGMSLIAEIKKASPSAGLIRPEGFEPASLARAYQEAGAAAISVITDRKFFQGELSYLAEVSRAVALPCLRKDFIIDSYQVYESRLQGASAILLIAAVLQAEELASLRSLAASLAMDSLIEVHDEADLERALAAGATIIGVNNRNLRTFEVSLETTLRLRRLVPATALVVSESGIKTRQDVVRLAEAGVDAVLVGEALMRSPDVGAKARELLGR